MHLGREIGQIRSDGRLDGLDQDQAGWTPKRRISTDASFRKLTRHVEGVIRNTD